MTVGMLGVAVLYVEGLRLNRTSLYRTTAIALAADMAERIRTNQDAVYEGNDRPGALGNCDTALPVCTPDELADDDWFSWRQSLNDNLPVGNAALIERSLNGPGNRMDHFDITLVWPEVGNVDENGDPDPVSYTLSVELGPTP